MGIFQDILVGSKARFLPKWNPSFATVDDKTVVNMFFSFLGCPEKVFSFLPLIIIIM